MANPEELFVFVGAGASRSMPAGLPDFNAIRDGILREVGRPPESADGLSPEPFLSVVNRYTDDLNGWLGKVLDVARPNAAHQALAQLAAAGAALWTVNFDLGIEEAGRGRLSVSAWPDAPLPHAQLYKPHGSLPGRLVATSEGVVVGLPQEWLAQLQTQLDGRKHVIFLGYSGRDFDLQPLWDDLLEHVARITWWSFEAQHATIRRILPEADRSRRLELPELVVRGGTQNPSADFVDWCVAEDLISITQQSIDELMEPQSPVTLPSVDAAPCVVQAIQQVQGDIPGAKAALNRLAWNGPDRRRALVELVALHINHSGKGVRSLLLAGSVMPRVGRLRIVHDAARRKRVNLAFITGRHRTVLRATRRTRRGDSSVQLMCRCGSVRMTGDLDAASAIGARAYEAATAEGRHDRAANAAFQWAMALTWSGRLDEAEECIQLHLEPVAAITDSRWLAWAQFTRAAIAIHRGNGATAIGLLDRAALRFDAERLIDGMVSVATVELVALRQVGDDEARLRRRDRLAGQVERRERGSYNYTRRHPFTMEAIALDDAEFARRHTGNHGLALRLYEEVARSPYPIHAALGHLGLATIQAERGETNDHAQTAYDIGISINARYVHAHAHRLIVASPEDSTVIAAEELFVP